MSHQNIHFDELNRKTVKDFHEEFGEDSANAVAELPDNTPDKSPDKSSADAQMDEKMLYDNAVKYFGRLSKLSKCG